jgi:hypothetical protein
LMCHPSHQWTGEHTTKTCGIARRQRAVGPLPNIEKDQAIVRHACVRVC